MARPIATLSIEAQEKHERDEKIFIEDQTAGIESPFFNKS